MSKINTKTDTDLAQALRELFETWLESRPSFRTTVEVQAAWEGWKANTAVAAMLAAHEHAQPASVSPSRGEMFASILNKHGVTVKSIQEDGTVNTYAAPQPPAKESE